MGLPSTLLQLSISANFLTCGLSSFTSPTPFQWEHLLSFWLALLLLNQEEYNYKIVYLAILSNLLFACSLGISISLQFGANTVPHSGPFTPLQWVSLLRILLTALLLCQETASLWVSISTQFHTCAGLFPQEFLSSPGECPSRFSPMCNSSL